MTGRAMHIDAMKDCSNALTIIDCILPRLFVGSACDDNVEIAADDDSSCVSSIAKLWTGLIGLSRSCCLFGGKHGGEKLSPSEVTVNKTPATNLNGDID